MVLQWATKRLCKFFLKRLNRFLNEEIDVEQLDVQLGSGTGTLTDLLLNVDYVNDQLKSLPIALKYGCIARIVVRLPCEIEVDGLDLLVAPRQGGCELRSASNAKGGGACSGANQQQGGGGGDAAAPAYVGVSDGVRIIGQMIKNLLLGLRVCINNVMIGVEGDPELPESYITLQIPVLKYGFEDSNEESSKLVKVIKFEKASVEIGREKRYRVFDKDGISGSVQVTIPCKEAAALADPNLEFDIFVDPVQLKVSIEDVNHLVSIAQSYVACDLADQGSVYHDTSSFYDSAHKSSMFESKCYDSFSNSASKSTLSVIADWMRKPDIPESDLAASMDEFFECFDAWNQSSSSSGIWNWTRSAFGAASVTEMPSTSQEVQMEYSITARFSSLSATLLYDDVQDGLELTMKDAMLSTLISCRESRFDAEVKQIEAAQLNPSALQRRCFENASRVAMPSFPINLKRMTILKIASSRGHSAARLALKQYHQSGSGSGSGSCVRTRISVSLQPILFWIDVDAVDKLAQELDRVRSSTGSQQEAEEISPKTHCKFSVSVQSARMFLSAANRGNNSCFAIDVGVAGDTQEFVYEQQNGNRGPIGSITVTVTDGVLYFVSGSGYTEVIRLRGDSQGKASVSIKSAEKKTGPWIAKKVWDGIASTKEKFAQSGRNNVDYASATCLSSDSTSATLELLTATSSSNIRIQLPRLRVTLSDRPELLFEFLASLIRLEPNDDSSRDQGGITQRIITLEVREVQAVANVARFVETPIKGVKMAEVLQLRSSRVKLVAGTGLGGAAGGVYLHLNVGEGEILERNRNAKLLCWKASAAGRGDGGAQNALSRGTAGISLSLVSCPGGGRETDMIVTGCMRGATIFTEAGNFDWVPAAVKLSEEIQQPFQAADRAAESGCRSPFFLFDLHDVALCYEPSDSSTIACALAAAALRASGGETAEEEYFISLRDAALHLADTKLRKSGDREGASLHQLGYAQVARAQLMNVEVRLSSCANQTYEVSCRDNQIYFDSCSDTTAAFGKLVAELQQLFAPDLQQTVELQLRAMKGKSPENASSSSDQIGESLFDGIVENAFSSPKILQLKQVECSTSGTVRQESTVRLVDPMRARQVFIDEYYANEHIGQTSSPRTDPSTSTSDQQSLDDDSDSIGGWYQDCPLDVFDGHVKLESGSPRSSRFESDYPEAIGRVIFKGWKIRWRLYGGSDWAYSRQKDRCVEVSLAGMDVHYDCFAPTGLYASSLLVEIDDVHVYDYSADARWKLILGYYHKRSRPRESTSKAVVVRMDAVRPNPTAPLEEYRLSLALLPICLHLDQAHIDFFSKFFQSDRNADTASSSSSNDDAILPFFQVCEMRPLIIRVDYIPRGLDFAALKNGNCFELFNMVSWKGVELQLKSVNTSGVYGWSSLMGLLLGEWLEDIFPRQVHKLLRAFGPIRPLYAVSSGAAKLIVFPAEQYKKDRRFLKGMRKGAIAFLQSLSVEALGLGANLAAGVHHILLHTEMGLGGRIPSDKKDSKRKCQPGDTREGLQQAYESLAQGLERTAISLVGNPVKVYQRGGGAGEAIANAIKASPAAILAPASATADAVRHAFLGVRNGLDPDRKRLNDRGEWK